MTLVQLHVLISLVALGAGIPVVIGLLRGQRVDRWTALFLAATVATSATGFVLPADRVLPSHVVGAISLLLLALAIVARYPRRLAGGWRSTYVVSAIAALYFNVFVAVVQAFRRVPVLIAAAPTQSEPPFAVAQLAVLVVFIVLGVLAVKRFRVASPAGGATRVSGAGV
jgi:hypothetical protein